MYSIKNAVPASLRQPVESSRYAQVLAPRRYGRVLVVNADTRAAALSKSRFARLPHEPEDAKLTGVTRSLQRRLMALNVGGRLLKPAMVPAARIA